MIPLPWDHIWKSALGVERGNPLKVDMIGFLVPKRQKIVKMNISRSSAVGPALWR